jgi:tRNA (Thr-GGU) A37 N-methylase
MHKELALAGVPLLHPEVSLRSPLLPCSPAPPQITQSEQTPYDAPVLGVFACRSPVRPRPIALTTAKILHVDHDRGQAQIANIDAFDGSPILDLKAYIPSREP